MREVTSTIIETQIRDDSHSMKDMADVVMIHAIYRQLENRHSPKVFILFTGGGHFQPVVRHLAQDKGKKVVLYGVKNSTSRLLKDAATECHEVPDSEAQVELCYHLIAEEFDRLFQRYGEIITSFSSLTQRISEENNIPRQTVEIALHDMMNRGRGVPVAHVPSRPSRQARHGSQRSAGRTGPARTALTTFCLNGTS